MVQPVSRSRRIAEDLARRIADGSLAPGASLDGVRSLARRYDAAPATIGRALEELVRAAVIETRPRRGAKIAPDGAVRAEQFLSGGLSLHLAGSDDPALAFVLASTGGSIRRVRARSPSSMGGLAAVWETRAEAALVHLQHADGTYNDAFAGRLLSDRAPLVCHLWRREQGLVVREGDSEAINVMADPSGRHLAWRGPGTGTRALTERLMRAGGADPSDLRGPILATHLEVAMTVAAGLADAGVAVRSAAELAGLAFVPLAWEPFEVVVGEEDVAGLDPLWRALESARVRERITALGGYDLSDAGMIRRVG